MADEFLRVHGRIERGDLDLEVEIDLPRGLIAVLGPNGAGKSSLLRVIAGLDGLAAGEVVLEGTPLDRRREAVFVPPEQRDVAMAFQEPRLFPTRSVLANIAYPLERRGWSRADSDARVRELSAATGLTDLAQVRPGDLSGGQAQRVNVARAIAPVANTLLLDEPLASIDERSRDDLRIAVGASGSERVLWVTHDPADAERADMVISIVDGRLGQTAP